MRETVNMAMATAPAASMYFSAWRIGWSIISPGWLFRDDLGRLVDFDLDSPAYVKKVIMASVRRWRLAQLILDVLPSSRLVRRVENQAGEVTILLAQHVVDLSPH